MPFAVPRAPQAALALLLAAACGGREPAPAPSGARPVEGSTGAPVAVSTAVPAAAPRPAPPPADLSLLLVTLDTSGTAPVALPHENQSSGSAVALARSDGLALVPAGDGEHASGTHVPFVRWSDL